MWKYPRTLFFPFSGQLDSWKFMGTPTAMLDAYAEILTRPAILAVEAVGLGLLAWVAHRGGLYRKDRLKQFLQSGKLAPSRMAPRTRRAPIAQKGKVEA
jgi:hypothetical protein